MSARRGNTGIRPWIAATAALAFTGTLVSSHHLYIDSYYDLYAGRYVVHQGIPRHNVITAVAHGATWVDQQWLAQALYYLSWAAGGYPAVAVLSAGLITIGFTVLARLMVGRGVPPPRAFAWSMAAFAACLTNTVIRAQSFAYLFFPLLLWLLLADARSPRPLRRTWLVLPVLVAWANMHGSVLLGAGITGLYAAYRVVTAIARRNRRAIPAYVGLGGLAAAAVGCTPYGTGIEIYYRSVMGNPELTRIVSEWAAPSLANPVCWPFFALAALAALAVTVAWRRGTRPDPLLAALAVLLFALALTGIRFQLWFAFAGSLLAADTLARGGHGVPAFTAAFTRWLAATLGMLALAALAVIAATPDRVFYQPLSEGTASAAATAAAASPGALVLGDQESSSALLWLRPSLLGRVGFDVRLEQYSPQELRSYAGFLSLRPGWQGFTRGFGIIVVSTTDHAVTSKLVQLPGWRVAYRSRTGLVMTRRQQGDGTYPR